MVLQREFTTAAMVSDWGQTGVLHRYFTVLLSFSEIGVGRESVRDRMMK